MPASEIAIGITSLRAALDLTKAMIGLRDAQAFRSKAIELQGIIAEALGQVIEARESHSAQIDRVRALEAEVAELKAWNTEKDKYELKSVGGQCVAFMLKPEERGSQPPHWLCPNCYAQGKKSFFQPTGTSKGRGWVYACSGCNTSLACDHFMVWL